MRKTPVAPGPNPFDETDFRVLPFKLNPRYFKLLLQQVNFLFRIRQRQLGGPLKRSVGLWNKRCDTYIDLGFASVGQTNMFQLFYKIDDGLQIVVGFGGKADHKIELNHLPAQMKCIFNGFYNIFFGDIFIDNVPKSLASGSFHNSIAKGW